MSDSNDKKRAGRLQYERLIAIDLIIRSERPMTAKQISKRLEVSENTINRDIEFIRDILDAPLVYDRFQKRYRYTEATYFLPALITSARQAEFLRLALILLEQYPKTPFYAPVKNLFESMYFYIDSLAPKKNARAALHEMSKRFAFFPEPAPEILPAVWDALFQALHENRRIYCLYKSFTNTKQKHCLEPYQCICKRGIWYIAAKLVKRNELRIFALHRIKKIQVLDTYFTPPKNYSCWTDTAQNGGTENIFACCAIRIYGESAVSIAEHAHFPDQTIKKEKTGSVLIRFTMRSLHETLGWLLAQNANVVPLEPPQLVTIWERELSKTRDCFTGIEKNPFDKK